MPVSFLSPARTVLVVSDDYLYVYATSAKGARLVDSLSWDAETFEESLAAIISKDCGGKPVLILNDTVEQHYRKEKVLRSGVGFMDRSSLVKRKLNVAFPNYPVKASYALKEKIPKSESSKKASDIYIFAAIPDSKQFSKTVAAVNQSLASIAGFCLLPVEASDMVNALAQKVSGKGTKPRWSLFIGQHRGGGLRQIVTKNGELALTRMTPVTDNDKDAEVWAGEVLQEFNATMSYLSRLGFQPEEGSQIITICNDECGQSLQGMMGDSHTFSSMNALEAAQLLGLRLGPQDDLRYADPLHAAWTGRKSRFILPMKSPRLEQVSKPRQTAMAASFLLGCGIAFLGYQLVNEASTLSTVNSSIAENQDKLAQLDVQYKKEVQRKEELGFDVRLVQSSIAVHDALEKSNIKPLTLYYAIGKALGRDLRVDRVIIKKPEGILDTTIAPAVDGKKPPLFEATLQMTYPGTTDVDKGNQEVRDLQARLQTLLPDHEVKITKLLKDYEYVEEVVVETGDLNKDQVKQDFVAEIVIKGPPAS